MDRRNFLKVGAAGLAIASTPLTTLTSCSPTDKRTGVLNISFQEKTAPGSSLEEKFDYMEKLGITGFEPHGNQLITRFNEFQQALKGRNIKVSAICAVKLRLYCRVLSKDESLEASTYS